MHCVDAAEQGDEADEARSGTRTNATRCRCVAPQARNRGHRLAAYRRCSADAGGERRLEALYASAFLLLIVHEIDSAYWHEWNLFGIPGGIQAFLLANVLLV